MDKYILIFILTMIAAVLFFFNRFNQNPSGIDAIPEKTQTQTIEPEVPADVIHPGLPKKKDLGDGLVPEKGIELPKDATPTAPVLE
ncbi:MAG: hypothetical protein MUD10_03815 [Candidatus Pacebacteria bacterium]|jgi:hypothetical protein|nr:hypothetical protein [Candidatus Paceibacterota bacterium]